MRFEVPQFIDVEDKIFGPLTLKQFIYLAGGAGLAYVCYKVVPFPFNWVLVLFFAVLALALAFYKLNNRPFIEVAQNFLAFKLKSKLYIWQRAPAQKPKPVETVVPKPVIPTHKEVTEATVMTLAQNLDILDKQ